MNQQEIVLKIFEYVILVFSLSLHEAAHGWMASRLGDPTARMLGRVTLNPMKHIDPLGTVLIPLAMLFLGSYGRFLIGWAKPTPVTTRNFKNITRDDILTTLAGPVSNVVAAIAALIGLVLMAKLSPAGALAVRDVAMGGIDPQLMASNPTVFPLAILFYLSVVLNLFLAAFNLLPLPPLDGSHILRHMLPYKALQLYDRLGMISLILMIFIGAPIVNWMVNPAMKLVYQVMMAL
ncbi:site-2 protease family protein [Acidipila rosea]|uniref:Zn-dependent protease n=1 Tax=Acidipila rosea TaxID=768535 RepID=A0A4R1L6I1_9BACT|nr:site-2 protease family protein [Acidipila rosea]TCK71889.1 Zn-dependent protease [Acidipila rosea]